ncbi:acyl-CoA-binding domain-containing protein 3 [Ziziphus jujuba]|uniref:Acyl-CoA-binding domain-containing protein 3 n=1 Tax=Ziziphus jujuba TaxID=326968 RepID=A0ABM3I7W1_ZIZJJ|nr:acyl-CoA-binding domain-containing protein 3-like [Ziziphus jujuba var. spinosa]XP_048322595.1 acyl-CoA-binding domain-containing protein 3 [Ziziphus jujuba]
MELVHELFLTASLALLLSFLVAKLVAFALAGDSRHPDSELKSSSVSDEGVVEAEKTCEDSLTVRGSESESRVVEFVREAVEEEVDRFPGKPDHHHHHHQVEEISEQVQHRREELLEEGSGQQSEAVVLPEKLSDGEETASAEKVCDVDPRGVNEGHIDDSVEETLGNRGIDVIGGESAADEEEVSGVVDESKGKDEVHEVGMHNDSEDDDWEGIERSEWENDFAAAVKFVESQTGAKGDDRLVDAGSDVQMELYGLHKVATEGPCYESQPMALKLSARAKWNAWQRLGNMSPEMAMEQYITILSDNIPGWREDHLAGEDKPESSKEKITIQPGSSTCFHNQPNERELELKSSVDGGGLTSGSHLESKALG